jgi:hypothetical protein
VEVEPTHVGCYFSNRLLAAGIRADEWAAKSDYLTPPRFRRNFFRSFEFYL